LSRWLAHPISVGTFDDARDEARVIIPAGALALTFDFALDADDARPPLPAGADDVRFAGVYGELVRVVADLCESAGLPPTVMTPLPERCGLHVALAPAAVGSISLDTLADSVILVRCAVELCAHARGLKLVAATVRCADHGAPADGRARTFLANALGDVR
jgi:hypothetical protein